MGYEVNLWKTEALHAELSKREEAVTSSYSAMGDFLQYIMCLWLRIRKRSDQGVYLVHEFSFTDIF